MERSPKHLKDIKPALTGYIKEALALLDSKPVPDDNAIHDVRVLMKRQRAAVRLIRPLLDEEAYKREYLAGREAGRMLCSWREMSVLRKTVKSLKKDNPKLFLKLWDNETIQNLLRKPYKSWETAGNQSKSVREISGLLHKALYRVRFLRLSDPDARVMIRELEQNYLVAAKAYLDCRNDPKPGKLHNFRKKSKTFMYQLCYFRYLNPQAIKSLEKRLDILTQNLGKYNDLAQIIDMIGYKYGNPDNNAVLDELAIVIKNKQDSYLLKAWPVAYRVFSPGRTLQDFIGIVL